MKGEILYRYFKKELPSVIFLISLYILAYLMTDDKFLIIFFAGLSVFNFIRNFNRFKQEQQYIQELSERGISEREAKDLSFLADWENKRMAGILRYCLWLGGVLGGLKISAFILFVTLLIQFKFFTVTTDVLSYIQIIWPIGTLLGIGLSYFAWKRNQQKFIRLTGPLH